MSGPKYTEADYEKVMAMPAEPYSLRDVERATGVSMSAADRMRRGEWQPPTGPSMPLLGRSRLTDVITDYVGGGDTTLDDLTVLVRATTRSGRTLPRATRTASGFATPWRAWASKSARAFLAKPDGSVYQNSECEWKWLSDRVSKAARWLGYVPFTRITDQRNTEPDPRAGGHLDLPAGEKELPETAHPITECDRMRSCAAPDPPIWRKIRSQ